MSKISELSDGGSLVSSDYLIAVRSGGNVKVRMDQINVDQVDLGDNEFIRLGNSQDLTMVHTSTQSIINQAGIGDLLIQKAGATKLTINASGIDVTGSVTADGLDLGATTDAATVSTTASEYQLQLGAAQSTTGDIGRNISFDVSGATTAAINTIDGGTGNTNALAFYTAVSGNLRQRLLLEDNGDISFYEDTGTTPKFVWKSADERLGIGTSSPTSAYAQPSLHIHATGSGAEIHLTDGTTGATATDGMSIFQYGVDSYIHAREATGSLRTFIGGTERMRIDASGHAIIPAGVTLGTTTGVYDAAKTLDDYEEGTWTGTLTGYTSAPSTAITATGTYTKIGRSVTAVISFSNKDSTGASGNIVVTGLPFTAAAGGLGAGWHSRSNTGTGTTNGVMSYIGSNNDLSLVNGLGSSITWVSTGTGTYAGYSITYEV